MTVGPLALVGSGEYLPEMLEFERSLLMDRSTKYVQIPTAAAPEGDATLNYWAELGAKQADRLAVEVCELRIRDVADANSEELANQVANAGLIYFSGGNPHYLAQTLKDSLVLSAVVQAWKAGAALAGCSAGAMALADKIPALRQRTRDSQGFGLINDLMVLPHFDRMFTRFAANIEKHRTTAKFVLGIDELTAVVSHEAGWIVHGTGKVHLFKGATHEQYISGDYFELR